MIVPNLTLQLHMCILTQTGLLALKLDVALVAYAFILPVVPLPTNASSNQRSLDHQLKQNSWLLATLAR
jgi:hypothetical protein